MAPEISSITVVGAGLAGSRTVAALREQGFGGRLTVVGHEATRGYDRPPLSKELLSRTEPAWFHDDLGIDVAALADELVLDDAAVHLETARLTTSGTHTVITRGGRNLTSDVVVLAVGSAPVRVPGWERALVLGTADDATVLRARLAAARSLVVVGAGWIGAEVAGVVAKAGLAVTVVEAFETPLAAALGTEVGGRLAPWYEQAGVRLRTSASVDAVGDDGVRLTSGEVVEGDVVLSAVGARPATGWLEDSLPLAARGGIPTDAAGGVLAGPGRLGDGGAGTPGRVEGLFAVGDCAVRADPAWGAVPAGHWSAALHDPELVAHAVLGTEPPAAHVPYVFSTQLGHDLGLVGIADPDDRVVLRRTQGAQQGWSVAFVRDGLLRAVLAADLPREVIAARKVLRGGPVQVDEAALADGVPLRESVGQR